MNRLTGRDGVGRANGSSRRGAGTPIGGRGRSAAGRAPDSRVGALRRGRRGALRLIVAAAAFLILAGCTLFPVSMPPRYAIVYGVSDYGDPVSVGGVNLNYPAKDATDMAALFVRQGYEVFLRTDAAATRAQLEVDVASVRAMVRNEDDEATVVFYFAGHGFGSGRSDQYGAFADQFETLPSDETGDGLDEYLFLYGSLPIATDDDNLDDKLAHAVSDDELASLIASIPARQRVIIIDACHSGGFAGESNSYDNAADRGQLESENPGAEAIRTWFDGDRSGGADASVDEITVLAAAGEYEFSLEPLPGGEIENGLFTHFLLRAARRGDANGDGYITTAEAFAHAYRGITEEINPYLNGRLDYSPRESGSAVELLLWERE